MSTKNKTKHRKWTDEEIAYLKENYGNYLDVTIAKNLNRSITAVKVKAKRLHLHTFKVSNAEYISVYQLAKLLKISNSVIYKWIKKYNDFPVVSKKIYYDSCYLVVFDKVLEWLERHQDVFNAKDIEPFLFGKEPDWLKKKRTSDFNSTPRNSKKSWTKREEDYLLHLLRQGKSVKEISVIMGRSCSGIRSKKNKLE